MNSYLKLKKTLGPYLLGIILALGATVAWIAAGGLVFTPFALFAAYEPIRESLEFTVDGDPLLVTAEPSLLPVVSKERLPNGNVRAKTSKEQYTYRTLEGQLVEIPLMQMWGGSRSLPGPAPRDFRRLGARIHGFPSLRQHLVYWYAIYRADSEGHTYFVGFDPITRRPIGYLTATGFHPALPTVDEQFTVDDWLRSKQADMAPSSATFGKYYLVSAEALYAIAFLPPSVRLLPMRESVVAVGTTEIPEVNEKGDGVAYQRKLVVRLPEALIVLNDDESQWRRVPIPPPARDRQILLHGTLTPDMILETYEEWPSPREIYWIDPEGTVVRQASVTLSRPVPGRTRVDTWLITGGMFPAPWLWVFRRSVDPAMREATLVEKWLPFAVVCLVSALLAVVCYRHQRTLSRGGAAPWAILVFLLGPPGFVGYWTHRRWPPKAHCEHCGAVVPRDRGTCLACAAEFPSPALEGIEIFA